MDDAEFDAILARANDPVLVSGIYNYCDCACDRCAFTRRCLSYRESRRESEDTEGGDLGPRAIALRLGRSLGRAFEMMRIIARREGIDLNLSPEELAEAEREQADQDRVLDGDPLVALARRYASTAWPIARALRPIAIERGDTAVVAAVERIDEICGLVSAKVYRAVSAANDPRFDPGEVQSDANGSAKIARLLVCDSRAAWRVLMEAGRAAANGVPAQLVRLLEELDAGLDERFPQAMAFVRPGFDEPAAEAVEAGCG